jgi:hypothetical protein
MKKLLATIGAAALLSGIGLLAAQPASAHALTLKATSACGSDGSATVTWTLDNDYDEAVSVTKSDNTAIPVGTKVDAAKNGHTLLTLDQHVAAPAAGQKVSATIDLKWAGDDFGQKNVTADATVGADCTVPTPPPTVTQCTATTNGGVSTDADRNGWDFGETRTSGHNDYVAGGIHVYTDSNTSQDKAAGYHPLNVALSGVGTPAIDLSDTSGVVPGLQLTVDRDGNGTPDGNLVNEGDTYGHGMWWTNTAGFGVAAGGGYPSLGTLDQYLAANPDAKVMAVGYSLGSGVKGSAVIHSITAGCTTFTFDLAPKSQPVLTGSTATGQCLKDAPWIFYDVSMTDPDHLSTSETVKLVLSDGTNSTTLTLGDLQNGHLSGKVLWPGAAVDASGAPTAWPGWMKDASGRYVQTTGNFAWTRHLSSATFVVNPELAVALSYPAATPNCITAPPTVVPASSVTKTGLADTGSDVDGTLITGLIALIAGGAVATITALRRRKARA